MAKPSKKSSNSTEYRVRIYSDGVQRLDGDIVAVTDASVTFRYPRKGSSAYEQAIIAQSKVIGLTGAVGKRGTIIFNDRIVAFEVKRANITNIRKDGMAEIAWSNTKGEPQSMSINVNHAEMIALKDVAKPDESLSGKKKKPGKKKEGAKKK